MDRDYASEVWDEPLGVVGAMDDEWDAGWGRGRHPERRRPSSARQRPSTVPIRALDGCIFGGRYGGRDGMRGEAARAEDERAITRRRDGVHDACGGVTVYVM